MKEVQNKWNTLKLNDDIWAKLIYFEQNRRLAKAYVSAPVLTIDGSTNGLDGFRIGLSGIDSTYRSLESVRCLRAIGQGIKLKIDNQGNILIRKVGAQAGAQSGGQCSIWIKDWPTNLAGSAKSSGVENCTMRELEKSDISYKLFDMRKFRLQLEKRNLDNDNNFMDWRRCVSVISFVRTQLDDKGTSKLLEDPCWLMIINIIAIDMLKSSICDKSSPNTKQQGFSSLAQQQSLLESHHNNRVLSFNSTSNVPLRTSSSSSVLSPSSSASLSNKFPCATDSANNLLATNERIKKLRTTTNNRFKLSPSIKNGSQYRKYQSTQQLSSGSNSTIYTTFNSKYINSKLAQTNDNSSTSDYNSASRSSTSGYNYWNYNQHPYYPTDSLHQRIQSSSKYSDDSKLVNPTSLDCKSFSLSNFDLSQRRFNLRSSIKMNYDNVNESDDVFSSLVDHKQQVRKVHLDKSFPIADRHSALISNQVISSPITMSPVELKEEIGCRCSEMNGKFNVESNEAVNHNECRAVQSREMKERKEAQKKVSRSSIDSSSSSSGCADNDYFMSHSSSSMSSSTASNERELFSQPASSSGIVCSGSTSDEYDEGRKLSSEVKRVNHNNERSSSAEFIEVELSAKETTTSNHKQKNNERSHCRAFKIKTMEPDGLCCNQTTGISKESKDRVSQDVECNCPSVEFGCDCYCDCLSNPTLVVSVSEPCACDEDSIYSRLPHPEQVSNELTKATKKSENRADKLGRAASKLSSSSDKVVDEFENNFSTIPMNQQENSKSPSVKDSKQSSGWLERRKYSKILPKFIFSSSSNNRQTGDLKDKNMQRKSSTLDRDGKFRIIRSTQDLSR